VRRAVQSIVATCSLVALVLAALAPQAQAQGNRRTNITTTGFPLATTSTSPADFDAGFVSIGSTTFTIDLRTNTGAGGFSPRVTTVNVQCAAPCPATGTTALSGLQWRRADLGVWNTLTTSYVLVESRTAAFNGANDPWQNTLEWRYLLSWTGTPPAAATDFYIRFELVVTAP
jgi:hypothetical protein